MNVLKNKSVLVTGGTGSFGFEFIKNIISKTHIKRLIIYSRDELKQYEMKNYFQNNHANKLNKLRFFIGDIRDKDRLDLALKDVDYVVHAAALKQVETCEYNPFEAIKTNVYGAQNIVESALKNNVKKIIALSTDKAVSPINLYGATKLASDKLFLAANNYFGKQKIEVSIVRYGNVVASRGSVIPFFLGFKNKNYFPITDKRMTRFSITLQEGVNFVSSCLEKMKGGEIFIPKLKSYKVVDIARSIKSKNNLKIIGIKKGEKLHEKLISNDYPEKTIELKNSFIILPNKNKSEFKKYFNNINDKNKKMSAEGFEYSSDKNEFLTISEIKDIISKIH